MISNTLCSNIIDHANNESYLTNKIQIASSDLNLLNKCIQKKKFSRILENQELFFVAMLQASIGISIKNFKIYKKDEELIAEDDESTGFNLSTHLRKDIDAVRIFFLEASKKQEDFTLFFSYGLRPLESFISNQYDQLINAENGAPNHAMYYLHSQLPQLTNFFDAKSTSKEIKGLNIYQITWKNIFKVKTLTPSLNVELFYQDALNEKTFLYTIYTNQKVALNVHSTVLRYSQSPFFKNKANSPVEELLSHSLYLDFSTNTVNAYVKYLYLGGEAFVSSISSIQKNDLADYFKFANKYEDQGFIDCCTNLFGLICNEYDIEWIETINQPYGNEHLHKLLSKLKFDQQKSLTAQA